MEQPKQQTERRAKLLIIVRDGSAPIAEARLSIFKLAFSAEVESRAHSKPKTAREREREAELGAACGDLVEQRETDVNGRLEYEVEPGDYRVEAEAFGVTGSSTDRVCAHPSCTVEVPINIAIGFAIQTHLCREEGTDIPCADVITAGTPIRVAATTQKAVTKPVAYSFEVNHGLLLPGPHLHERFLDTSGVVGAVRLIAVMREVGSASLTTSTDLNIVGQPVQTVAGGLGVSLRRSASVPTPDLPLWVVIRKSSEALSFSNFLDFTDLVLCGIGGEQSLGRPGRGLVMFERLRRRRFLPYNDADAYRLLKVATEAFVLVNCAIRPNLAGITFSDTDAEQLAARVGIDGAFSAAKLNALWNSNGNGNGYLEKVNGIKTLLYLKLIREKLSEVRLKKTLFRDDDLDGEVAEECFGILESKLTSPCLLELIWSYWQEEGMLVQTMNALSLRFQNVRSARQPDALAMLEIDPLRPVNNLLWGYIQDEQHRLTVQRRAYEYDHHYGITLQGKAIPPLRPADSRSKFLEAFHHLLYISSVFFKEDDDTTVIADAFPVLNALQEVHFLLAEGAHNQFGDLPSTARQEMLLQQWILARPELREFLPTRIMVAYPEPWMDRVDAMKKLQGWTDLSIRDFHELAVTGERILLSVRYGAWGNIGDPANAANWARFWRPEIQNYIHSYRAVTGVDLSAEVTHSRQAADRALPPSAHIARRLAARPREALAGTTARAPVALSNRPLIRRPVQP